MREILFRGKEKDTGRWVYGDLFCREDGISQIFEHENIVFAGVRIDGIWNKVDAETVGQYTGVTDKNGVKIFEGDIVKTEFGRLCGIFRFISGCFNGFDLKPVIPAVEKAPSEYNLWRSENLEVVGNIFDGKNWIFESI